MQKDGDSHISGANDKVRIFIHVHAGKLKLNYCKCTTDPLHEWDEQGNTFSSNALPWDDIKGRVSTWLTGFGSDFGNLLDAIGQEYGRFV